MIAGFETPASGELSFDEVDLRPLPPAKRPVAIVFQDHNLFPHLSARENARPGVADPSLRLTHEERAAVAETMSSIGAWRAQAR